MRQKFLAAMLSMLLPATICLAQDDPSVACNNGLAADSRFISVSKKLPLAGILNISFEMLANESLPTALERKVIAAWVSEYKECAKAGEAYRLQNYPPRLIAVLTEAHNSAIVVTADLYNRKLTYGAANKRLQLIADDVRNKVATIIQQIQSEKAADRKAQEDQEAAQKRAEAAQQAAQQAGQQAAQQRDEAARQAAQQQREAMFNQGRYQCEQEAASKYPVAMVQRMISPGYQATQPQLTQTDCTRYGNQLNCTSRPTGSSAAIYNRPPEYITEDSNARNRNYAFQSCLSAKGYIR